MAFVGFLYNVKNQSSSICNGQVLFRKPEGRLTCGKMAANSSLSIYMYFRLVGGGGVCKYMFVCVCVCVCVCMQLCALVSMYV